MGFRRDLGIVGLGNVVEFDELFTGDPADRRYELLAGKAIVVWVRGTTETDEVYYQSGHDQSPGPPNLTSAAAAEAICFPGVPAKYYPKGRVVSFWCVSDAVEILVFAAE